jgi:hypothetical protein
MTRFLTTVTIMAAAISLNGCKRGAVNLIRFISYSSRKMSVPIQAAANDLRLFL